MVFETVSACLAVSELGPPFEPDWTITVTLTATATAAMEMKILRDIELVFW
jgi:hypothetical protein